MRTENNSITNTVVVIALTTVLGFSTGCGSGLAQVTGKVTQDGQPLATSGDTKVSVMFQSVSGSGVPAVGTTDANGEYQLSTGSQVGLPPGEYLVSCTGVKFSAATGPSGIPQGERIIDLKYGDGNTSGLRFTVQEGKNRFDIALEAPKKR